MQQGSRPAQTELTASEKRATYMLMLNYVTQALGIQVTLTYLNFFMTNALMLTPLVVAGILTVGRVIDTACSVIAGPIVQKSNLKTGPYRTFILINGPLLTIGNFLIFLNPNVNQTAKTIIFIIGYLFRNLPQNFLIAAQQTLIGKVAGSNQTFRLAITAQNYRGTTVGGLITSFTTVMMVDGFNAMLGNNRGYLAAAMVYCVIQTIGQFICWRGLAPYDQYDPNAKKIEGSSVQTKLTHVYGDTLKNRYVWVLFIRNLIAQITMNTLTSLTVYNFTYCLGGTGNMAINRTAGSVVGLIVTMFAPAIARKLGKKNSILVGAISGLANNIIFALFSNGNFPLYLGFTLLGRVMIGPQGSIGINQWIDAADYQFYVTGRDSRPFIMSLSSLTMKVGQFISTFTYVLVLSFCNYSNEGGVVTIDAPRLSLGLYGFIAICNGISLLIYIFGWNKTDAQFAEYAEHNRQVMAERAAAAAAASTPSATAPAK